MFLLWNGDGFKCSFFAPTHLCSVHHIQHLLSFLHIRAHLDAHAFQQVHQMVTQLLLNLGRLRYWALRKTGVSAEDAQKRMSGISNSEKNEILFEMGINYNDFPLWQKRGVGMYFLNEQREGYNPVTNESTSYTRRSLHIEMELPIGQEYSELMKTIIDNSQ